MSVAPQNTVEAFQRTLLHRETYIATLKGALSKRGTKKNFADKVGITQQYLSYLLDPYNARVPSREVASKIVDNAPIPGIERGDLLNHLLRANPNYLYLDTADVVPLTTAEAWQALRTVADSQFSTYIKQPPEVANRALRVALQTGSWAMTRINPYADPYIFTEMAMHLHNAACALNLPINAFWYAKASLNIAENPVIWEANPFNKTRIERIVNSWRMLSVTYHNLGLAKSALSAVHCARDVLGNLGHPVSIPEWTAHLAMEELNALAISSRFSITEAEYTAAHGMNGVGLGDDFIKTNNLLGALIQRNLVETYIRHGSKRSLHKAQLCVEQAFTADHLSNFGALTQTLHLRTGANLAHKMGDKFGYRNWLDRAHRLATDAGLTHQRMEIDHESHQHAI